MIVVRSFDGFLVRKLTRYYNYYILKYGCVWVYASDTTRIFIMVVITAWSHGLSDSSTYALLVWPCCYLSVCHSQAKIQTGEEGPLFRIAPRSCLDTFCLSCCIGFCRCRCGDSFSSLPTWTETSQHSLSGLST